MGKLKVCVVALAAAAVLLAGQAWGRDLGKGRSGNEEVVVHPPNVYRRLLQLERKIAATLNDATLGENEPLVQQLRQQLKEAREEAALVAPVYASVYREVARQQAVKKLAREVQQLEQSIAATLKIATRGEDEPLVRELRQKLKKARDELAEERERERPGIEQRLRGSPRK
jgi:hypothetical protein